MSSNTSEFNGWPSVLDYKARILYAQIVRLQREVAEYGGDDRMLFRLLCRLQKAGADRKVYLVTKIHTFKRQETQSALSAS